MDEAISTSDSLTSGLYNLILWRLFNRYGIATSMKMLCGSFNLKLELLGKKLSQWSKDSIGDINEQVTK